LLRRSPLSPSSNTKTAIKNVFKRSFVLESAALICAAKGVIATAIKHVAVAAVNENTHSYYYSFFFKKKAENPEAFQALDVRLRLKRFSESIVKPSRPPGPG
jgi:hypothetical protein